MSETGNAQSPHEEVPRKHPIFIAGAAQDDAAWKLQVDYVGDRCRTTVFSALSLTPPGEQFGIDRAADYLATIVEREAAGPVILCGLSLGAMIALDFAGRYPSTVAGLVLSGAQLRPHPLLMRLQNVVIRLLPERVLGLPKQLPRARLLEILASSTRTDLRKYLPGIAVPTIVLCGARDWANRGSARKMANAIPAAELRIVVNGGHQLNTERPDEFNRAVDDLLGRVV